MALNKVLDSVAEELSWVEEAILSHAKTDLPLLTDVAEYILNAGGKRLRPALVLLSAKLFKGNNAQTIQVAQIVEYLHTATLLHDDVVDNAEMRRSQKTAHCLWGKDASVLVGDYLFAVVFQELTKLKNLAVLETLSHTTTLMAKGEILQLARSSNSLDEEEYLEIIVNKTACLFASALKIGAILAGASETAQHALYDYGMAIGLAFQIVDDALDYIQEQTHTGKLLGIDLKERKITLPLIHLMKTATATDRAFLEAMLLQETITESDIQKVGALMAEYGSIQYALEVAQNYANTAQKTLQALPDSSSKQLLHEIAEFIVIRRF